jgi:hypothetical protein
MCDTQILVEVTRKSQLIVCLVDCVQQIYDNHKYVDAASIADEAWRARSGLWITSANEDCIQGSLNVASHQLMGISIYLLIQVLKCFLPLGGNTNQPRRGSRWPTLWMYVFE